MDADATRGEEIASPAHATEPKDRAEHLRRCPACAAAVRGSDPDGELDPDLELRLLRAFRDWRDGNSGH